MVGIPFNTSTITVTRDPEAETEDGYSSTAGQDRVTVAENVRAVISTPSATTNLQGGERVAYNTQLHCDPCDLMSDDQVVDSDGHTWRVLNVVPQSAFGLSFLIASMRYVEGASQ